MVIFIAVNVKDKIDMKGLHKSLHNYLVNFINPSTHTYRIGYYNPSVRIIDLVSHTTYVVCVNFIHKWRDLQF